jgi:hypothetical protein
MSLLSSIGSALGGFKLPKLDLGKIGKDIVSEGKKLLGDVVHDSFQLSNKPGKTLSEDLSLNILGNNITLPNPITALANKLLGKANDFLGKEGINVDFKQLLGKAFHMTTEDGGSVAVPGIANRMGSSAAATSALSGALATGGGSVQASNATGVSATGGGVTSTGSVSTTNLTGSSSVDNLTATFGSASDKLDGLMNSISDKMSPADLAKVQAQIQKYQQLMSTLSDLLKKDGDMKMNTIGNLRG